MELSYLLTFIGGFCADLARRIFLPESERWINKMIPSRRRNENRRQNLAHLDVRKRLEDAGADPSLVGEIEKDSEQFLARLNASIKATTEAYVDVQASALADFAQTQAEMNNYAFDQFAAADRLLISRVEALSNESGISDAARQALLEAHAAFEELRKRDGILEGLLTADGGSMEPLVRGSAMEAATIARIAKIAELDAVRDDT